MEIVDRACRVKKRTITLHRNQICKDIDLLSYKLGETALEGAVRDSVASDSADALDGAVISRLLDDRAMTLRKRLAFCIEEEEVETIDNTPDIDSDYEFKFRLPKKFKDSNMAVAMRLMHDYLVRGTLMDWYNKIGTSYGVGMVQEVTELESKILDIFRVPGIVSHPFMVYYPSYRSR